MGIVSRIVIGFCGSVAPAVAGRTPSWMGDVRVASGVGLGAAIGLKGLFFLGRGERTGEVPCMENGRLIGEGGILVLLRKVFRLYVNRLCFCR